MNLFGILLLLIPTILVTGKHSRVTTRMAYSNYYSQLVKPEDSTGKGQEMTMSSGLSLPFYLHELGHTFGFPHEQDRPDRDTYVYWDKNKDPQKCTGNFANKVTNLDQAAVDIPFDYVALMADWTECYYPNYTNTPKDIPLGGGSSDNRTYSVVEIERINAIHGCRGCYGYRFVELSQLSWADGPFAAGTEVNGETFYVCRVYHEGHLLVGKSLPDDNKCYVGWPGGAETEYHDTFSVLTNPQNSANLMWVEGGGGVPQEAIKGGRTKDRETIYIGRCNLTYTVIPGYYTESNPSQLRVTWAGGVDICNNGVFEALVCN